MNNAAQTLASFATVPANVREAVIDQAFATVAPDYGATPELMRERYMAGSEGVVNLMDKVIAAAWLELNKRAAA
jgi:hypothetical protein